MPKFKVYISQSSTVIATVEAKDYDAAEKAALQDYSMGFDNVTYHEPTVEEIEELDE